MVDWAAEFKYISLNLPHSHSNLIYSTCVGCELIGTWRKHTTQLWTIRNSTDGQRDMKVILPEGVPHTLKVKVKWSRYRPGVTQRVGRGIALLFHDRGARRGWVFSSTPRPHITPGKDPVPILQKAGWAPGPVWTGGKSRPHQDSIPDSYISR